MATITHNPVQLDARRTSTAASTSTTPTPAEQGSSEPSRAASVFPVLAAFGALLAFAVGVAYFGREAVSLLGSLLGGV